MKFKLLLSLLAAGTLSVAAQQGYKDGVEYYRAKSMMQKSSSTAL